ncbi:MAG TPA: UDP-N-acetylglucosamine 2-epimerase (non-hydrolyzing) [Planctomycetota bacterium]|nr:UDP-N-acetylglucosamine 2-epimerase (non-hydrolyzing) [Planctomycetota bacterium]
MTRTRQLRVVSVIGTRPEAIKMAPLVRALSADERFESLLCVTGQHRHLLDQVLHLFELEPDDDLEVMSPGQDLFDVTSRVLTGMRGVLDARRPDLILVHGDTTTCFAAALAANYRGIGVAHVEAGLRSGDLTRPFPEELNRVLVDRMSNLLFAPTERARDELLSEGCEASRIHVVGNTVVDALLGVKEKVQAMPAWTWRHELGDALCTRLAAGRDRVVLVTGHRRENFGAGFQDLCKAIRSCAQRHPDWLFVYPVHLNPNVQQPVREILSGLDNVALIEPLAYEACVWLMLASDVILTDSGGMQEEGLVLGKPVLVMREVTERQEAVAAGIVRLVGTDPQRIQHGLESVLGQVKLDAGSPSSHSPYGDGHASELIVEILAREARVRAAVAAA